MAFVSSDSPLPSEHGARIVYADGLRLLAISLVVLYHVIYDAHVRVDPATVEWIGTWGVDCFFVLTGFLLAGPFLRAIVAQRPLPHTKLYAQRRFLRIYPLYFVSVVLCAAFVGVTMHEKLAPMSVLTHLALVHGFSGRYIVDLNWALWTMSVDAQFYVLLPIVAYLLHRIVAPYPEATRRRIVWRALGFVAAASLLERFVVLTLFVRHGIDPSFVHITAYCRNVIGMGANFAIGAALAYRISRRPTSACGRRNAALAVAGSVVLARLMEQSEVLAPRLGLVQEWTFVDFFGGLSAASVLYALLRCDLAFVGRWLARPVVATLAGLAYAVYLFHEPILWVIVERAPRTLAGGSGTWGYAAVLGCFMLAATLCVALPLHIYVERPFLRLKERKGEGSRTEALAPCVRPSAARRAAEPRRRVGQ